MTQAGANRVLMNVIEMCLEVAAIFDTTKRETWLPHAQFGFQPEGKSSFHVLHGLFERDVFRRREEQVDVIGHQDEGMKAITAFCAIFPKNVKEKFSV